MVEVCEIGGNVQATFALICPQPQHSREEQMDMLTDKYKKVESDPAAASNPQAGEMMAFVSVEEPVVEDLSDGQRLLLPSSFCLWYCHRLPFSQSVCANA